MGLQMNATGRSPSLLLWKGRFEGAEGGDVPQLKMQNYRERDTWYGPGLVMNQSADLFSQLCQLSVHMFATMDFYSNTMF